MLLAISTIASFPPSRLIFVDSPIKAARHICSQVRGNFARMVATPSSLGKARYYELSEPIFDYEGRSSKWIMVSEGGFDEPETYAFLLEKDPSAFIVESCWSELSISRRGFHDCDRILREDGWVITLGCVRHSDCIKHEEIGLACLLVNAP